MKKNECNNDLSSHAKIVVDFEGCNIFNVKKINKNHFECQIKPDDPSDYPYPNHQFYWFFLQIPKLSDSKFEKKKIIEKRKLA